MIDHALMAELAEIDRTLLGGVTTAPPDPLRSDERILTRAYLLLSHAVLEERVETIFLAHFRSAIKLIAAGDSLPSALLPFYAAALEWGRPVVPSYAKRSWLGYISAPVAEEHVVNQIKNNHGLKQDNVQDLAKLVGIEWAIIDEAAGVEIAALTTLGAKRGTAGHTSPFSGLDKGLDGEEYPANVREWVMQAARTVLSIEAAVAQLSARTPQSSAKVSAGRSRRIRLRSAHSR